MINVLIVVAVIVKDSVTDISRFIHILNSRRSTTAFQIADIWWWVVTSGVVAVIDTPWFTWWSTIVRAVDSTWIATIIQICIKIICWYWIDVYQTWIRSYITMNIIITITIININAISIHIIVIIIIITIIIKFNIIIFNTITVLLVIIFIIILIIVLIT